MARKTKRGPAAPVKASPARSSVLKQRKTRLAQSMCAGGSVRGSRVKERAGTVYAADGLGVVVVVVETLEWAVGRSAHIDCGRLWSPLVACEESLRGVSAATAPRPRFLFTSDHHLPLHTRPPTQKSVCVPVPVPAQYI